MKPAPFRYSCPLSLEEALAHLAEEPEDAKILAGGQSLVPMMNFRVVTPVHLIDINHIDALATLAADAKTLEIGALVRYRTLETSSLVRERLPVLGAAVAHVAHRAVRNRGTFGGSLAHADPSAELPAVAVLCEARIQLRSPRGERTVSADDFFEGALSTVLAEDEILTGARLELPLLGSGWGFAEVARRQGDFAIAGALATLRREAGVARDVRLVLFGVGGRAWRLPEVEAMVNARVPGPELLAAVSNAVGEWVEPEEDPHAGADYRRHLARVLAARVLGQAWERAEDLGADAPGSRAGHRA